MASGKSMLMCNIIYFFKNNTFGTRIFNYPQRYILRSLRGTRISIVEKNLLDEINETIPKRTEALPLHPNKNILEEKNHLEEEETFSEVKSLHVFKGNVAEETKNELLSKRCLSLSKNTLNRRNFVEERQEDKQKYSAHSNKQVSNKGLLRSTASEKVEITLENQHDMLSRVLTPYCEMDYTKQLRKKYKKNIGILKLFGRELKSNKVTVAMGSDRLPCPLHLVVPSPVIGTYRNKDEFNVRKGVDGNPKTVGFFAERTSENPNAFCIEPEKVIITKDSHKAVAKDFQNYLRQSPLAVCYDFKSGGHWRNLIVRSNVQGDVMAIIVMHPQQLTEEELTAEKNNLKDYFSVVKNRNYDLKSLYFQACRHTRCTHQQSPFELLLGDPFIVESINGLKFQISPESFFQVNTVAAESMYNKLLSLTKATEATTILDVCCGTGTIGLNFAPHVHSVIGIDISSQAIEDAKINAEMNNIRNAQFICGRADHVLLNMISQLYAKDLIVIANPSRNGLNKSVVESLRKCKHLKKIVYISCKPDGLAMDDFVRLCKPAKKNSSVGVPFLPMLAIPVDLFPHTDHCELIMLFQRL